MMGLRCLGGKKVKFVGIHYKKTAGDATGKDCFALSFSWLQEHGFKLSAIDCFLRDGLHADVYRRQIELLSGSYGVKNARFFLIDNPEQLTWGDILLFAVKSPSAIDHLGIHLKSCTHNFLHMTRQSGSVISDLSAGWQRRMKGVIRCRLA